MKPIIKYISLLLCSGLILPFYYSIKLPNKPTAGNTKIIATVNQACVADPSQTYCFTLQHIVEILVPQLKK